MAEDNQDSLGKLDKFDKEELKDFVREALQEVLAESGMEEFARTAKREEEPADKPEPIDETQVEDINGIDRRVRGVEDEALLPQGEDASQLEGESEVFPLLESFIVAVEVANNPGYIGLTYNTGVIQTDTTITKTQAVAGDGFVTLSHWDSSTLEGAYGGGSEQYISGMTVDDRGHVTAISVDSLSDYVTSSELSSALGDYYTKVEADGRYWIQGDVGTATCYGESIGNDAKTVVIDLDGQQLTNGNWEVENGNLYVTTGDVYVSSGGLYYHALNAGVTIANWTSGGIVYGITIVERAVSALQPGDKVLCIPA